MELQFPSVIRTIIVYNRSGPNAGRLEGAFVSLHRMNSEGILETLVEQQFGTSAAIQTIDFTVDEEVYVATLVRIRLPFTSSEKCLSLAEVEVMGYVVSALN